MLVLVVWRVLVEGGAACRVRRAGGGTAKERVKARNLKGRWVKSDTLIKVTR